MVSKRVQHAGIQSRPPAWCGSSSRLQLSGVIARRPSATKWRSGALGGRSQARPTTTTASSQSPRLGWNHRGTATSFACFIPSRGHRYGPRGTRLTAADPQPRLHPISFSDAGNLLVDTGTIIQRRCFSPEQTAEPQRGADQSQKMASGSGRASDKQLAART